MIIQVLPGQDQRALELFVDELADTFVVVGFDQRLRPRCVLVGGANDDHVGVGRLFTFDGDGVGLRVQAGFHSVVGVDDGGIDVIERTRQLRGIDFGELDLLRVVDDVGDSDLDAGVFLELDQALRGENQQRAAAIGRVVRDGDSSAASFSSSRLFTFLE